MWFTVTNPVDVIKIRMQLDNELSKTKGKKLAQALGDRYYKGFLRGALQIAKDEGVKGLYKGYVHDQFTISKCIFSNMICYNIMFIINNWHCCSFSEIH